MKTCALCFNSGRAGVMSEGKFICDSCLNSPRRTRPWLYGLKEAPGVASVLTPGKVTGEVKVPLNKVLIQDDDEEGAFVAPPSDSNLPAVTEAEIARAKEEAAKDTRRFEPSDERTLKRIGAAMTGAEVEQPNEIKPTAAEVATGGSKAAKAAVKGAKRSARSPKRPKARAVARRRAD